MQKLVNNKKVYILLIQWVSIVGDNIQEKVKETN